MDLKSKTRWQALLVSATLLLKPSRGTAEDDYGDYRHEFYREDDHRMSIDTDSATFDIGLGDHVRLGADFVLDSISGATPTGAPPQSQWPFVTFANIYDQRYNQLFQPVINDPNNLILFQSGYFNTFQDYTNYIASVNPQIGSLATNAASTEYHTLTNNPHFHSTKVPLTELHDLRRAATVRLPLTFGINQITPEVSISKESDYHSYGFALDYALLLNQKNTTLNLGWSHDADRVRDANMIFEAKTSDDILVGVTQLLTPKSYLTVNFTYGQEYGYLSDPYRAVMAMFNNAQNDPDNAALTPENRPRRRVKETFYTSYTQFIEKLNGSAEVNYRFFHDDSDTFAHTLELAWHQKIGRHLVFTPSFRYYYQTAAYYYNTIFVDANNLPHYYSSDYRLSELNTFTLGASLHYRVQKHFAIDLAYTRYIMQGLDSITSPSAYPSANVYSIGGRIFF